MIKDIKGYEGLYAITDKGEVYSYRRKKNMKLETTANGYVRVNLYKDGKTVHYLVHRLVAEAFIANPNNLPCVNHKDYNREHNTADNLEWCSYEYNNQYSKCVEAMANAHKKQVKQMKPNGELIKIWDSCADAERALGIKNVYRGANGTRKTVGGYKWEYI